MSEEATGSAIHVEVAYATIERQCVIPLKVTNGTTAYAAIRLSKIEQEFEEIDIDDCPIGIFGSILDGKSMPNPKEYVLQDNDRVEIYRLLTVDPKEARIKRAASDKAKKIGQGEKL